MKAISVIIPIYHVEDVMDRCIESVVTQTYPNLEIILVDDGSNDNCSVKCDNWKNRDKRIKVIHQKNKGLSGARNSGLKIATGNYILYVDSDDFLEKEEAILQMLKTVFDPEIPVNIYDLGLIYGIELKDDGVCEVTMTLTAPSCPASDFIVEDIRQKVGSVEGIKDVNVTIVFEPEWTKDMMSEEAKLELGFM